MVHALALLLLAQALTADEYVEQAKVEFQAKHRERAIPALEACVALGTNDLRCLRLLGSAWAVVGGKRGNAKATAAYRRYLEVAPPDDPFVEKVKAILGEDDGPESTNGVLKEWLDEANQTMKSNPARAVHVLELALGFAPAKHPLLPTLKAKLVEARKAQNAAH